MTSLLAVIRHGPTEWNELGNDNIDKWAKEQGASGLAYFTFKEEEELIAKGMIGKSLSKEA